MDAHGDLSLSIPLLTVPGRDGLDFEIVAQYRSGIQVTQSASWIGLGWSLDLGSITRHPLGALDYVHFSGNSYQTQHVDWARALPATFPGSGGVNGLIQSRPDAYVVTMNGNSVNLLSPKLLTQAIIPQPGPASIAPV